MGLGEKEEGGKEEISVLGGTKGGKKMSKPNYTGTYNMVEQDNMDSYLGALGKTSKLSLECLL